MTQPIHDILNQLGAVISIQLEAANDRAVRAEADYARLCQGLRMLGSVGPQPATTPANDLLDVAASAIAAKPDPVGDAAQSRMTIPDQPFLDAFTSTWQGAHAIRKAMSAAGLKVAYGTVYKRMAKLTATFPDMIEAAVEQPAGWRLRVPAYVEPALNMAKPKPSPKKARGSETPLPANDMPHAAITDVRHRVASTTPPQRMFAPAIHRGDCFETMKSMADGSVDLILTDPP